MNATVKPTKPYLVLPRQVGKYLLKNPVTRIFDEFDPVTGCVADASYAALSTYTMILPALSKKVPEKLTITNPLWNYFDSVCSIFMGLRQLIDPEDGLAFTRVKGAINVSNGVQQLTLTALNFAKYGTPSFVVAAGVTLGISIMDTVEVMLRRHNFDYWLRVEKARYLKMRSDLQNLEADIAALESLGDAAEGSIHQKLLTIKIAEKEDLETAKNNCIQDIIARSAIENGKGIQLDSYTGIYTIENDFFIDKEMKEDFDPYITIEGDKLMEYTTCHQRNGRINRELEAESYEKITDTCIQTLVFAGMLLTCFSATPLQVVGLLCIGISIVWMAFKRVTEENKEKNKQENNEENKSVKTPSLFFAKQKDEGVPEIPYNLGLASPPQFEN